MSSTDDELASAWLDGELDDDERARVADDPGVARARRELGPVRDLLAEPVPVPAGLADRQIAVALAALEGRASPSPADEGPVVVPLDARRRATRSGWWSRAAAVVLVVAGIGVGLSALGGDDGGGDDLVMPATEERSTATADESAADSAGSALSEELATTEAPAEGAQGDDGEAESSAAVDPIAATATELLARGPLDAAELTRELEDRFGPPGSWELIGGPPAACGEILDRRTPGSSPHVALAIRRDDRPLELVVPTGAPPIYVEPGACQPVG